MNKKTKQQQLLLPTNERKKTEQNWKKNIIRLKMFPNFLK